MTIKARLLNTAVFGGAWGAFRRRQLHSRYAARRERYARLAAERGLCYREEEVAGSVRRRLAERGFTPAPRRLGEVHTFAFVPDLGWHRHLLPDLEELGPVTRFDYVEMGIDWHRLDRADESGRRARRALNEAAWERLREAHARRPVDWVFAYASGLEIRAATLRRVHEEIGVPTVGMCLDDKQSWSGPWMGDHRAGQVDVAGVFDLAWTSARVACEWYLVEGGRPLYLPEGFDRHACRPRTGERDISLSFVGASYGFRRSTARYLRRHGLPLRCYGRGWEGTGWVADPAEIFHRSRINLGMGGIGYSESLTNVKARDFEIPASGGGVYLTSFNPDLARHFHVGREILCYRNRDELLELGRDYLAHPDAAAEIARRGRERCLAEHRWLHRYQKICRILGILAA